jgi:plastocyanin
MSARRRALVSVLLAALALAGVFAATAVSGRAPQATGLSVTASDFKFRPAKLTATSGQVVVRLTNRGSVRHDLRVAGKKTARIRPGKSATLAFANLKPGRYPFVCTVPGHADLGMRGTLVVKQAPAETTEG